MMDYFTLLCSEYLYSGNKNTHTYIYLYKSKSLIITERRRYSNKAPVVYSTPSPSWWAHKQLYSLYVPPSMTHMSATCEGLLTNTKKKVVIFISSSSEESTVFQVVLDNDVSNSVKDKLHVLGICGAGEVGVNLLGVLPLVQVLKLTLDVGSCFLVRVGAWERQGGGSEVAQEVTM